MGKGRAAGRVGSGQTFCRQSRVGSGRVNVMPGRVGSGPRKVTRGQLWVDVEEIVVCPMYICRSFDKNEYYKERSSTDQIEGQEVVARA